MRAPKSYRLTKIGRGWQCQAASYFPSTSLQARATGWGSRPDLAIRNYLTQLRLQTRLASDN